MYLNKKTYVKRWDHQSENERHSVAVKRGGVIRSDVKEERISYVVEEVAYWRKANAIHQWFVDHCADGLDNCGEMYVKEETLKELLDACKIVVGSLKDKERTESKKIHTGWAKGKDTFEDVPVFSDEDTATAREMLPSQEGFFFGSTEYDKWYVNDLEETIKMLEPLVEEGGEFYYEASW